MIQKEKEDLLMKKMQNCKFKAVKYDLKDIFYLLKEENKETSLSLFKQIDLRYQTKLFLSPNLVLLIQELPESKMITGQKECFKGLEKTYVDYSKQFKTSNENPFSRITISRRIKEIGLI